MKVNQYSIMRMLVLGVFLAIAAISCSDDKDEVLQLSRMFMPGDIKATSGETDVKLEWDASLFTSGKTVQYIVDVSKDTLFGTVEKTFTTDEPEITITDVDIIIKTKYFARVKAAAQDGAEESKWVASSGFGIRGEQIFQPLLDANLKDVSVLLKWRVTSGLTKIVLTPATGDPMVVELDASDNEAGEKFIDGLTPSTGYIAEIFQNDVSKGTLIFTTPEPSIYTIVLTPADNLVTAVANAADGDVIGLEPGVYDAKDDLGAYVNLVIIQKSITIESVSGNPADTKVNFKEVTLKGTNAGVTLKGIEFDGLAASGAYFLNLTGLATDSEAATFKSIVVENCVIHNTGNCLLRGNRGAVRDHKIELIKFRNCIAYDNLGTQAYTYFTIDKLEFGRLELINSTFHRISRDFIVCGTVLTGAAAIPVIFIDGCTINSFGSDGRNRIILDANANPVNFTVQNSIIANSPKPSSTVGNDAWRATGSGTTMLFTNNNIFKLTNGAATPAALVFPSYAYLTSQNIKTIDLGWDAATNDFSLPADSELRTSGTTGGPVGDPRWAD